MFETIVLGLSLYTWHAPQHYDCSPCGLQNETPGVYVVADDYTVGYVRNSLGHPSWYAGRVFHAGVVDFTLGAITGYQYHQIAGECGGYPCMIKKGNTNAALRPLLTASYQFDFGGIKPRVALLGKALHVSVEHVFK